MGLESGKHGFRRFYKEYNAEYVNGRLGSTKMTSVLKQYYAFKAMKDEKLWDKNLSDSEYEDLSNRLMAQEKALFARMTDADFKYLIDHSDGKQRYSYQLIFNKRKEAVKSSARGEFAAIAI